jgi:hypothetical protein
MTQDVVARTPYRYAVGLMIETDKVSEQLCHTDPWADLQDGAIDAPEGEKTMPVTMSASMR